MAEETAKKDETPKTPSGLPRIRTYAADISRVITARGETVSSIATAQREKGRQLEQEPVLEKFSKTKVILFGSVLFVVLGVVVIATSFYATRPSASPEEFPPSIVFPNKTTPIEFVEGSSLQKLLATERRDAELSLGEVERIVVTQGGVALAPSSVARALGFPDAISREVVDIMIGVHSFDRNQPFLILSLLTFDRTFSALLGWEKEAGRALNSFYAPINSIGEAPDLVFSDSIIQNLDVRKSQSTWPIMYTYPSRVMVVLTTNEFTLREVMTRLGSAQR